MIVMQQSCNDSHATAIVIPLAVVQIPCMGLLRGLAGVTIHRGMTQLGMSHSLTHSSAFPPGS
jgi:hypothetical protein